MLIGVSGDDFTGSSDIANNLKKAGMSVTMYTGIPKDLNKKETGQAAVIALKIRTAIKKAVKESLNALKWLKEAKCKKYIFKYCSTATTQRKR